MKIYLNPSPINENLNKYNMQAIDGIFVNEHEGAYLAGKEKVEDILDTIENEALFEYLKETDPIVLEVILLKINGYSIKEISKILELSTGYI